MVHETNIFVCYLAGLWCGGWSHDRMAGKPCRLNEEQ